MGKLKILVTGATGFVGRRLCESLRSRGNEVVGLSRTRPVDWTGAFVEADLSTQPDLKSSLSGVDAVVHLASRVHMGNESSHDLLPIYRKQVTEATLGLARVARAAGVRRFVYMSTVKAVGEKSEENPFRIDDQPRPSDPYGISKLEAETGLQQIALETGLEVAILRPPLVYGPGVKANFLALIRLVQKGFPLPLGSIRNRRSLVFVGNLVSAIETCLSAERVSSRPYFVADDEVFSTPELIFEIAKAIGRKPSLWPMPRTALTAIGSVLGQSGKVSRLTESLEIDTQPFKSDFNWKPPFRASQGLKETAGWMQSLS